MTERSRAALLSTVAGIAAGWLALAVLVVGVWPAPLLKVMQPTVHHLVSQAIATKL